ncbi:MAG TPA: YfhO family protein [Acidobacteriota bacterium]|nr:YfhO family protein [Acidobacteriota bacterium]
MDSELQVVEQKQRWYRNQDLLFPILLALLGVLFFADLLFSTKNFFFRDVFNFHYPLRKVMIDSYAHGEFPLWNPYVYLGQPMLANPNYMALYPTNLLNLVVPFAYAFKLHMILHAILAGIGLFFLQRRLGIPPLPALAGSIAYQFSGSVLSFLNLFSITQSIALLPWIGWAFLGCLQQSRMTRILGFGGLLALQVITMEPIMLQCCAWLIGAIAAVHLLDAPDRRSAIRPILRTLVIGIPFALGLSAIQILPSLELLRLSVRGKGYLPQVINYWSMHPADLVNLIIPNLFGSPYAIMPNLYWGERFHSGREGYLVSLFMGTGAFFLALLSSYSPRRKLHAVLSVTALLSVFLALGQFSGVYGWICRCLPILRNGRYPIKFMLLAALALSILASLGLESALSKDSAFHRRRLLGLVPIALGLVLGAAILCFAGYAHFHSPVVENVVRSWIESKSVASKDLKGIVDQLVRSSLWAGSFCIITLSLVLSAMFWRRTVLVGSLVLLALGAELIAQNARLTPLISGADFDFVPEVDNFLSPELGSEPRRVYHVDPGGFLILNRLWAPNRSAAWIYFFIRRSGQPLFGIVSRIQYALSRSIDDLNTRESNEIFWSAQGLQSDAYLTLLARLNTSILLTIGEVDSPRVSHWRSFGTGSDRKLNIYRLKDYSPRAYVASSVCWVNSPKQALEQLLDSKFPYERSVILEGPVRPDKGAGQATGKARILNYQHNLVRCEVDAETQGHLVLLDSFYPGWNATLDGDQVPILRANYAFRAVEVPRGKHVVEFRYTPTGFYLGLLISAITLMTGTTVWFSAFLKRKPN